MRRLATFALLALLVAPACRDDRKRKPMSDKFPAWVPTLGQPLPGHGDRPAMDDSPYRPLTVDELVAVADVFHPRISVADMDQLTMPEYEDLFWNSPEEIALTQVQRTGYAQLGRWQELCADVALVEVPGLDVTGHHAYIRGIQPTLRGALFTPHRW